MKFAELTIGMKDSLTKTFGKEDVLKFADISGDHNPIHVDEEAGKASVFGRNVAHGALVVGLVSAVLGSKLPGDGTIYLGQNTKFRAPVFWGDTIKAEVEVIELREDKKIVTLATNCYNEKGEQVNTGTAVVKLPE